LTPYSKGFLSTIKIGIEMTLSVKRLVIPSLSRNPIN
jgi:hypothetical protein